MNEHWLAELFAAIDGKDAAAFADRLTADARFHFGNAPPVEGRESITRFVAGFFDAIQSSAHARHRHWTLPGTEIVTGEVSYVRLDGSTLTVPYCNVFTMRDGLIEDYRVYVDNSQLFA